MARWLLPMKKKVQKHHLSALYITFLLNGADISKFFSYVFEDEIITDSPFVYFLLGTLYISNSFLFLNFSNKKKIIF